jgi:hypothetical protein
VINAFACVVEVRAFAICCPACSALYEIRVREVLPALTNTRNEVTIEPA